MNRWLTILAIATFPAGAVAQQPAPAKCALFNAEIERGLRRLAYATYSGDQDSSVFRQQVRFQRAANALAVIQANLHQLDVHKCLPFELPITPDLYEEAALKCERAEPSPKKPAAVFTIDPCDMQNWRRSTLQPMGGPVKP